MSDSYLNDLETQEIPEKMDWAKSHKGSYAYEDIGDINYTYLPLSPLMQEVRNPSEIEIPGIGNQPVVIQLDINAPMLKVHSMVANSHNRTNDVVLMEPDKMERAGTTHLCLTPGGDIEFKIILNKFLENKVRFVDFIEKAGPFRDIVNIYDLEDIDGVTRLTFTNHAKPPFIMKILFPILKPFIKKRNMAVMKDLKEYCENNFGTVQAEG